MLLYGISFSAISVKEMSKVGNSCKKNLSFLKFWFRECENLASFVEKLPTQGTFDGEISLAKGSIFTKINLANGNILTLWTAHPYPKFGREPEMHVTFFCSAFESD